KWSERHKVHGQAAIKSRLLEELKSRVEQLGVRGPRGKGTFVGPVINKSAVSKFRSAVQEVRRSRGRILCGGRILREGIFGEGYYVEPTLVSGLSSNNRLFREELFLPFVVVGEFKTLEEALEKANDTEYGLTAGIFSEDPREVERFMDVIQFGVVYANRRGGATT